jgi:prepilin signal peptidase PulO-like enzyme (type II secretory pathway)
MIVLVTAICFALGATIASFVGVVVDRIGTEQGFVAGRSRCDACAAPLKALVLVPIVSYLLARGRARCCGALISLAAPASEALLGALFVLAYLKLGLVSALPAMFLALATLLALVRYDLRHQILPPALLGLFALASIVTAYLAAPSLGELLQAALLALVLAGSLALIHVLSRGRAMGLADAPLTFALALLTGSAAFPGFVFSFWIGAVIGILLLVKRPKGSRMGVEVPFAPFLAAGFLLAYFTQWNPFLFAVGLH